MAINRLYLPSCLGFSSVFMETTNISEMALELGRVMTEMKNFLRQFIQAKIKEHSVNITFEMLEIMACLWKKDGINQQEIADVTIKDKSSMTYLVDNLVKRNLIARMADANDRRNNLIFLTEDGKMLQEKLHPWLLEMYGKATVDVTLKEVKQSIELIKKMNKNIKAK